ncbi:helix-turn-helix transcriptional regulator [Aliikangiella coralliicola]|uniref:Transcriptional regulator n=1 Tax=Aliikangiella coralliicola TaxID=2592383 RepID=A0A545UGQ6_9GAMM|nr:metalloregulator ArsR/SmtB family transcription factor [Aliikangiella coralliicola]TQV88647.1 transcriptional regulator [Aliikangiella coralliicola]
MNTSDNKTSNENNASQSKILHLLKTRGELTAGQVAEILKMTSMGARQHLENMEHQGLLEHQFIAEGRGRPKKKWYLTRKAQSQFPNTHSALLVNLLGHIQQELGENALDNLITIREKEMRDSYQQQLAQFETVPEKLSKLAEIRTNEGYMAEVVEEDGQLFLVENNCPICSAATQCQQFCRSELSIFKQVLGCKIERTEYILEGARRCAYRVEA